MLSEQTAFAVGPLSNSAETFLNQITSSLIASCVRRADHKCGRYQRIPVKEVIGPIIDSSTFRLKIIHTHPPPHNQADVKDILSDSTGVEFQVFQEKKDSIIKTIAAGIFDLGKMTWSIFINKPNMSEPVAILPIKFSLLDKLD